MGKKCFAGIIFSSALEDLGLLMRENCFLVKNTLCYNKLQRKKDQNHIFSRYQKQDKNFMGFFSIFF